MSRNSHLSEAGKDMGSAGSVWNTLHGGVTTRGTALDVRAEVDGNTVPVSRWAMKDYHWECLRMLNMRRFHVMATTGGIW